MAVHKVPQDVEADDKFLGPLSFKQFLFFGGAVILAYFIFLTYQKGLWPLSLVIFFPFAGLTALSIPWSKEQPTEVYLAARLRFFLKPRRRIWNQTGMSDLVTVTAPIRQIHAMTDGLNQTEVRSRFNALATMIDSRGWAVKNYTSYADTQDEEESDRLVAGTVAAPTPLDAIAQTTDDVLDDNNSIVAKQFDSMIHQSETKHKSETQRLIEEARQSSNKTQLLNQQVQITRNNPPTTKAGAKKNPSNNEDFWFMHQNNQQLTDPNLTTFSAAPVIVPGATSQTQTGPLVQQPDPKTTQIEESAVLETIHQKLQRDKLQTGPTHGKTLQPVGSNNNHNFPVDTEEPSLPAPQENKALTQKNPDILNLARNNDLNISTIAKEANKSNPDDGEVVISLR